MLYFDYLHYSFRAGEGYGMFLGILVGMLLLFSLFYFLGDAFKKTLEIISLLGRICVCGCISMLLCQTLSLDRLGGGGLILCLIIGTVIVYTLIALLAGSFRLVGYSVNFMVNSLVILIVASILGNKYSISFPIYAATLFFFPRILWISDRFATECETVDWSYNPFTNVETEYYVVRDVDRWEDSEYSWNHIPVQIIFSSLFYGVGCLTFFIIYPVDSAWLMLLCVALATAVNVVFDLFVFRKIDIAIS